MAKYTVTHICGHEREYQIYGKHTERDRKIAWLAGQECPACRRKAVEEAAKEATKGMELPELEGSEKQVKWANTIRGQFINAIRTYNKTCAFGAGNPRIDVDKALSIIASVKTARDFIDNRDMDVIAFLILMSRKNEQKPAEAPAPAKEEEAADVATEDMELPELKGSEKQVEWANTIRGNIISYAKARGENMERVMQVLRTVTTARAFIDNRDLNPKQALYIFKDAADKRAAEKAAEWGKVAVNAQNVECTTERGAKINMPHSSEYDGYSVWVSLKLLRSGRHSYEYLLSVKADMEFTLKKYGHGKWNKSKVLDEKTISAEQMAEAFGGWASDAPQYSKPAVDPDKEEIIKHVPAKLEPVEIEADPELVR